MRKEFTVSVRLCDLCRPRRGETKNEAYSQCALCRRDICERHFQLMFIGGAYYSVGVCSDCFKTEGKALELTARKEMYEEYVVQEERQLERWSLRVQHKRALKRRRKVVTLHDA